MTILLSGESPDQTLTVTVYKSDGSIIEQKNTPLVFTSNQENCRFSNSIPEGDEDYYEEYLTLHCHKGLTGWLKFCQPKDEDYVELYYATMYYTCLIILPSDTWPAISSLVTQFATPK